MPFVTYEARRGLAPGHVEGSDYTLSLSLTDLQRPSPEDLKNETESLSGTIETLYFGEIRKWTVMLAPMRVQDAALHYEFLRSTADGQTFTFDPYGTEGSNVEPLQVVRADKGYAESVFVREGRGGRTDWVSLGFEVREV